ncbi:MAG: hypothetical protein Q8P18_01900 [Pseudomonadota bacterium]|nr:hypothetical protein [Pseudomonadota bacterium]
MNGWRVTKYHPARRDSLGRYLASDWTAISDVGRSFDGVVLTLQRYLSVEQAYVDTAMTFHSEAGSPQLVARDVEPDRPPGVVFPGEVPMEAPAEGARLTPTQAAMTIRACLRELFWCRLEGADGGCGVHFGYDFYMYLTGLPQAPRTHAIARERGLFVESLRSPDLAEP